MNPLRENLLTMTRRQLFGRAATGIGTAALASLLAPRAQAAKGLMGFPNFSAKAKRVIYLHMSGSPPQTADTTIPQGVPCARLANLILAPKEEAKRIATYIPRWGIWLAAHLEESKAWAIYRERLKRFASLIGDREPIVLQRQLPGMGRAKRYIITIADDDRRPLDTLCHKLTAADIACDVMRNLFGPS